MFRLELKQHYVDWFSQYEWGLWGTFALRSGMYRKTAVKCFHKWIDLIELAEGDSISWVRVAERGPELGKLHFHVLVSPLKRSTIDEVIELWGMLAGDLQIGTYDPNRGAMQYSLKSFENPGDPDIDQQLYDKHLRADCAGMQSRSEMQPNTRSFEPMTSDDFARKVLGIQYVSQMRMRRGGGGAAWLSAPQPEKQDVGPIQLQERASGRVFTGGLAGFKAQSRDRWGKTR